MTPSRFARRVGIGTILVLVAGLSVVLAVWPAYGQAASAPAITPNTACGAPGVGRLVGVAEPVVRSASEAAGTFVNSDGYWSAPCLKPPAPPPPPAACLPATRDVPRVWQAGGHVCRSQDPDRTIPHERGDTWVAVGPTRGALSEVCDNGARTRVEATCAQATTCNPRVAIKRNGVWYMRGGELAPVANGTTINLRAADGSTWPATCATGEWSAPSVLPRARPETPTRPAVVLGCRSGGVWSAGGKLYRYDGPLVPSGQAAIAQGLMGAQPATFVCDSGRWVIPPAPPAPAASVSGAEEWRRGFEQQQRDAKP